MQHIHNTAALVCFVRSDDGSFRGSAMTCGFPHTRTKTALNEVKDTYFAPFLLTILCLILTIRTLYLSLVLFVVPILFVLSF